MKNIKEQFIDLIEKREIGIGSRVIVDQSRFRSGRDPGRRMERCTGTVKKYDDGSETCYVEFDKPVTVKGQKKSGMAMKKHYISELVEAKWETSSPGAKAKEVIMDFVSKQSTTTEHQLSDIVKLMRPFSDGIHFKYFQSAAKALAKQGKIGYDGISVVTVV